MGSEENGHYINFYLLRLDTVNHSDKTASSIFDCIKAKEDNQAFHKLCGPWWRQTMEQENKYLLHIWWEVITENNECN